MKRIDEYILDPVVSIRLIVLAFIYVRITIYIYISPSNQQFKSNAEPDVLPEPRDPDADFNKLRELDETNNGNDSFEVTTEDTASTISVARSQPASARKSGAARKPAVRSSLPMKFKVTTAKVNTHFLFIPIFHSMEMMHSCTKIWICLLLFL